MPVDLLTHLAVALIGAIGLIIPGWLTYKGVKLGRQPKPQIPAHDAMSIEASKTRDFIAREHDETRRQAHDGFREIRETHERLLIAVLDRRER